jgi:hypothetical protein
MNTSTHSINDSIDNERIRTLKKQNSPLIGFAQIALALLVVATMQTPSFAQDSDAELAKKLANPIASLISVPIQANYDGNIGPTKDGSVWRINIQPVIPISLNENWNLISRTILPVIDQSDVPIKGMGESGIGDIVQSIFFSPTAAGPGGWIWGAGPVLLLPTGSDDALSAEQWGVGPTAVTLKQTGPWTYGALVNHIWTVAGEDDRTDVNATFVQPFLSYITKTKTTFALNMESTYDWEGEAWSVPINLMALQLLKIKKQIIQVGGGARYWADSPDGAAEDWGARIQLTMLFPK